MILNRIEAPNGHFLEEMIVYGSLEKGGVVSKGFRIEPPCLRSSSPKERNAYKHRLIGLLKTISGNQHIQVQWSCNSDYTDELTQYHEATEKCDISHIKKIRSQKLVYFWEKMQRRELRREELVVFHSIKIDTYSGSLKTKRGLWEHYEKVLQQFKQQFKELEERYRLALGLDTLIKPMGDYEHFCYFKKSLNPSITEIGKHDFENSFSPDLSIQENCLTGDCVATQGGFYYDGNYNTMLALSRWPSRTHFGIFYHLTSLGFLDYQITVNVHPLPTGKEVKKEEAQLKRLHGEYMHDPSKESLATAISKKRDKIGSLSSGYIQPFEVEYIIRIWDKTEDGMRGKVNAVKQAVSSMNGAQCFECSLPTTAKNMYFNTWPGNQGNGYRHRRIYAEDSYLSDLIPFSASFTAKLHGAEALYDGNQGNLVGLKTFEGNTPQHTVLLGMSGAGKSVHMQDILEQTEPFYDYTAIIEEGLSYEKYTKSLGETPIIIQPDGDLTINYFDTMGMPLGAEQLSSSVALVSKMIGETETVSEQQLRQAQIEEYIKLAYKGAAEKWAIDNQDKLSQIQRIAYAVYQWKSQKLSLGDTYLDAYSIFKEGLASGNEEIWNFYSALKEEDWVHFCVNPDTGSYYDNLIFAYMKPEDFCTHWDLVDLMRYSTLSAHNKEEIKKLATLLNAWTASGQYGKLFDGISNISLNGRVAHFELGYIGENAQELKTACGLLIAGYVRQHIITMPRKLRKRIIFEEVARLLDVPGGEKIVSEAYAQLRKFSCCATSIVQQYSKFKQSKIRPIIMGNSKQYWIMKQMDRGDLEDMAKDITLPETAMDAIQNYPLPEHLPQNKQFSSICYYSPASQPSFCGTMRNVQLDFESEPVDQNEKNFA